MCSRPEQARLFFALVPPLPVRRAVIGIQQGLEVRARAVKPENLHLTLLFLGQVPLGRIDELKAVAAGARLPSCTLRLSRLGSFPRAGVAFLAPDEPVPALDDFRERLAAALARAGFAFDGKAWRPHLTLYRKMRKPCPRMQFEPVAWPLRDFRLVASELHKGGPRYRDLERWEAVE